MRRNFMLVYEEFDRLENHNPVIETAVKLKAQTFDEAYEEACAIWLVRSQRKYKGYDHNEYPRSPRVQVAIETAV